MKSNKERIDKRKTLGTITMIIQQGPSFNVMTADQTVASVTQSNEQQRSCVTFQKRDEQELQTERKGKERGVVGVFWLKDGVQHQLTG